MAQWLGAPRGLPRDSTNEDGALPHRAAPALDEGPACCSVLAVPAPDADTGPLVQGVPRVEAPADDPVGGGVEGDLEGEEPVEDPGPPCRWRHSQAVLDVLSSTDVRRLVPAGEDAGREVPEWELRERRERGEERSVEAEELPLFLPMPSLMTAADEE